MGKIFVFACCLYFWLGYRPMLMIGGVFLRSMSGVVIVGDDCGGGDWG